MSDKTIVIGGLGRVFFTDDLETHALRDVTFSIGKGEFVSITGPSGCGKSTLLSLLGLLDVATSGEYYLSGHSVSNLSRSERARFRNREIGFIFQAFNLISELTVFENVELPLTYRREFSAKQRREAVMQVLEKVDMTRRHAHYPSQLSGGQQQRVAVARSLAGKPAIILADEPTGNLDSKNAQSVMELLQKMHQDGATICMVTHDPRFASAAQRTIYLQDGMLLKEEQTLHTQARHVQ